MRYLFIFLALASFAFGAGEMSFTDIFPPSGEYNRVEVLILFGLFVIFLIIGLALPTSTPTSTRENGLRQ